MGKRLPPTATDNPSAAEPDAVATYARLVRPCGPTVRLPRDGGTISLEEWHRQMDPVHPSTDAAS